MKFLLSASLAVILCSTQIVSAETISIIINDASLDEVGVTYPKMPRNISVEEPGVSRIIEPGPQSNQYTVKQVVEVRSDWKTTNGYCNKGDIAVSAKCTFEKGVEMHFLLNSHNETDEIIGIGCAADVAEKFVTKERRYGNLENRIVCQKK